MKKIIILALVIILVSSTVVGVSSGPKSTEKTIDNKPVKLDYSHKILAEYFTMTTCIPCKYAHSALKALYAGGWHPFYYITYVYDKNDDAKTRKIELEISASPTVAWDGGYRKDVGGTSNESEMSRYNTSIIKCGNRDVNDIDITLDVEWLGAVNPSPKNGETDESIDSGISWTNSEMEIDVEATNNGASQYIGHLHVYITEKNSTLWDDKFGYPYTFEFKDYAWNEDITISSDETWSDSRSWDGDDYSDGHGHNFEEIEQDNTMVIAAIFDEDNDDYTDETEGFLAGVGTDPKTFDVYFGDSNPPPKVSGNQTDMEWAASETLEWETKYYWKIDVWDNKGNVIYGPLWNFTTRENNPPYAPSNPSPQNGETEVDIDSDLYWFCTDPDGDSVTYDVYFEAGDSSPDELVSEGQPDRSYDPGRMDFSTTYYWKIVAKDRYGFSTNGPIWHFKTEKNLAPIKPSNPIPADGANNVFINTNLSWISGDPNSKDNVTYDIYFEEGNATPSYNGTIGPFPPDQENISYDLPGTMEKFETYYWKIVAKDGQGKKTTGPLWIFQTGINDPPLAPSIEGLINGSIKINHNYNFTAEDPDNDNISYYIDWGDGTSINWSKYYLSDMKVIFNHTWNEKGTYNITAKVRDIYGQIGPETVFVVTMPKNKPFNHNFYMFNSFFDRVSKAFPILKYILSTKYLL